MFSYILRKLLLAVPLLFGVITLIFILVELSPGDATDRFFNPETPPEVRQMIEQKWGLDRPAYERYFIMIGNMMTGNFGNSIAQDRPVFELIGDHQAEPGHHLDHPIRGHHPGDDPGDAAVLVDRQRHFGAVSGAVLHAALLVGAHAAAHLRARLAHPAVIGHEGPGHVRLHEHR